MIGRLAQETFFDQSVAKTGMCARVVGMERQRSPPFRDCAIHVSPFKQHRAEIVMRVGIVGPELDRLPEISDGFIGASFAREHVADAVINKREAKLVMTLSAARAHGQRFLKIRERVVQLAAFHQQRAKIFERNVIVLCHRQRVRPQRFAISPVGCLLPRAGTQDDDDGASNGGKNFSAMR